MTRLPRPDIAHVAQDDVQDDNNRTPSFFDDDDRRRYPTVLREASLRHCCSIHAYENDSSVPFFSTSRSNQ